jgi:hypothetical protein
MEWNKENQHEKVGPVSERIQNDGKPLLFVHAGSVFSTISIYEIPRDFGCAKSIASTD